MYKIGAGVLAVLRRVHGDAASGPVPLGLHREIKFPVVGARLIVEAEGGLSVERGVNRERQYAERARKTRVIPQQRITQ